jgi:hypothetical protein
MSRRAITAIAVAAICVIGSDVVRAQQGESFKCDYRRVIICASSGCKEGEIGSAYLLVPPVGLLTAATNRADRVAGPPRPPLPTIQRCVAKGCSPVVVRAVLNGAFINISQDNGAYFLKILTVDLGEGNRIGDFVEVASTFLSTITYFGSCKPAVN